MGFTNFQIVLDSPTGVYYADTNVTGRLQFNLDKPKKIRGEIELPPGDHVYPFSTTLPKMLPSSFEGEHGNIRYKVKATLDRPWKFNQHVEKVFTVVTPVDLNYNLKAKEPAKLEVEKYFCCCWCKSGPLTLVISLPFSGYVPGQNIPVTVEVDNASNVRVDHVVIRLEKVLKYIAREPKNKERADKVEIVKLTLDAIEANGSKSYTHQIAVPMMPQYNLEKCSIINCSYTLQVTAEVSGCHCNLDGEVPIFLGTVPIYHAPASPPLGFPDQIPSAPPPGIGPQAPVGFITNPGPTEENIFPTPCEAAATTAGMRMSGCSGPQQ